MIQPVVIRLSLALVFVALLHAIIVGLITNAGRPPIDRDGFPLVRQPIGEDVQGFAVEALPRPPAINYEAQNEMKQAGCPSGNCGIPVNQGERIVHVGPWRTVTPAVSPKPAVAPQRPIPDPFPDSPPVNLVNNVSDAVPPPTSKKYQVSLFLDASAKSQEIKSWFETDPNLIKLRNGSDFQVYTSSSPLYRTRYAAIVPAEQFPVILLTDATGGHIHAAGSTMIPQTADELWSDFRTGAALYKQAKGTNVVTGAIKTRGYSWDDAINPAMQLSNDDCPDGNCPQPDTGWRPFDRVRPDRDGGGLFDDVLPSPKNLLTWATPMDLATIGVFGLAFVLTLALLFRRSA